MHELWEPYRAAQHAQRPLSEFLSDPAAAHQADNLCTRLLLGEHPLAPPDRFIADPQAAAAEACARIDTLGYADVLERGADMYAGLEAWFGSPLSRERLNETDLSGGEPVDVADFTNRTTMELVHARTAADRIVWAHVATRRGLAPAGAADLADSVFAASVGRIAAEHAAVATGPAPASPEPPSFPWRLVSFARRGPRAWLARLRA
jgi:hypothetical protein